MSLKNFSSFIFIFLVLLRYRLPFFDDFQAYSEHILQPSAVISYICRWLRFIFFIFVPGSFLKSFSWFKIFPFHTSFPGCLRTTVFVHAGYSFTFTNLPWAAVFIQNSISLACWVLRFSIHFSLSFLHTAIFYVLHVFSFCQVQNLPWGRIFLFPITSFPFLKSPLHQS